MLVPNRVGTHCCPTSRFTALPADGAIETMGINRFVYDSNRLLEFSLIVRIDPNMPLEQRQAYARSVMNGFWRSLEPIRD